MIDQIVLFNYFLYNTIFPHQGGDDEFRWTDGWPTRFQRWSEEEPDDNNDCSLMDEVGEWIVLDGLVLGGGGGGMINGNDEEEESNKQWRASVSQVVELLTVDG